MSEDESTKASWTPPDSPFKRPPEFDQAAPNPEFPLFIEKFFLSITLAHDLPHLPNIGHPPDHREGELRWRTRSAARTLFGDNERHLVDDRFSDWGQRGTAPSSVLQVLYRAFILKDQQAPIRPRPQGVAHEAVLSDALLMAMEGTSDQMADENLQASKSTRIRAALSNRVDEDREQKVTRIAEKFDQYFPYLLGVINGEDTLAEEAAVLESLKAIAAELAKWGIRMELDPVQLGLAALWDEQSRTNTP